MKFEIEEIMHNMKASVYYSFVRSVHKDLQNKKESIFEIRYLSKSRQGNTCFICRNPFKSFYGKEWFYERTCSCP